MNVRALLFDCLALKLVNHRIGSIKKRKTEIRYASRTLNAREIITNAEDMTKKSIWKYSENFAPSSMRKSR